MSISACPNCNSRTQFKTVGPVSAGGGYAPNYLPGLGGFFSSEKFDVVVCKDCGFARLFASVSARAELASSPKWQRV